MEIDSARAVGSDESRIRANGHPNGDASHYPSSQPSSAASSSSSSGSKSEEKNEIPAWNGDLHVEILPWVTHAQDPKKPMPINSVDIHPDGKSFVTAGKDCRTWSLSHLRQTTAAVSSSSLASASSLPIVNGVPLQTVPKLSDEPKKDAVADGPAQEQSASSSASSSSSSAASAHAPLMIWEGRWGCFINCVRYSPDGNRLAWATVEGEVVIRGRVILPHNGKEDWVLIKKYKEHESDAFDLSWSRDGAFLASCGVDNRVVVWNTHRQERVASLTGHQGFVKGVAFDPIGRYLASEGEDRCVTLWNTRDWTEERRITEPFKGIGQYGTYSRISWSPTGSHLLTCAGKKCPLLSRDEDFIACTSMRGHHAPVSAAKFHPRSIIENDAAQFVMVVGASDGTLTFWSSNRYRAFALDTVFMKNKKTGGEWQLKKKKKKSRLDSSSEDSDSGNSGSEDESGSDSSSGGDEEFVDNQYKINDVAWCPDATACISVSENGQVTYVEWPSSSIGRIASHAQMDQFIRDSYGDIALSSRSSVAFLPESPAFLLAFDAQQQQQQAAAAALQAPISNGSAPPVVDPASLVQKESRTQTGKRRIQPVNLTAHALASAAAFQPPVPPVASPFVAPLPVVAPTAPSPSPSAAATAAQAPPPLLPPSILSKPTSFAVAPSKQVTIVEQSSESEAASTPGAAAPSPASASAAAATTAPRKRSTKEAVAGSDSEREQLMVKRMKAASGGPSAPSLSINPAASRPNQAVPSAAQQPASARRVSASSLPPAALPAGAAASSSAAAGPSIPAHHHHHIRALSPPPLVSSSSTITRVLKSALPARTSRLHSFSSSSFALQPSAARILEAHSDGRIQCISEGKILWSTKLNNAPGRSSSLSAAAAASAASSPVSSPSLVTGNTHFVAIACTDGSVHILSADSGSKLLPPLFTGNTVKILDCSTSFHLLVLNCSGDVILWDVSRLSKLVKCSAMDLMSSSDEIIRVETAEVTETGVIVVKLSSQTLWAYHTEMGCWAKLADSFSSLSAFLTANPSIYTAAAAVGSGPPPAAVPSSISMLSSSAPGALSSLLASPAGQVAADTMAHLEHCMTTATLLQSPDSYCTWLYAYARFLTQQAEIGHLRTLCDSLLGPQYTAEQSASASSASLPPLPASTMMGLPQQQQPQQQQRQASSSSFSFAFSQPLWQSSVLGMQKRKLLEEVIKVMQQNPAIQRLCAEYSQLLEAYNNSSSGFQRIMFR